MAPERSVRRRNNKETIKGLAGRLKGTFPKNSSPDGRKCKDYETCAVPGRCHKASGKIRYVPGRKKWSYCRYWSPEEAEGKGEIPENNQDYPNNQGYQQSL